MPITAPPIIDPVPTPVPTTANPGNFDAAGDALLGWFPPGRDQIQAVAENVYANAQGVQALGAGIETLAAEVAAAAMVAADAVGLVGRSNSPLTVDAGIKAITLLAAKPSLAVLNKRVAIVQLSDPSIKMFGTVSSVTSSTVFSVTVVSSGAYGSGNYSAWQIIDAAFFATAASKEVIWAGADDSAVITAKSITDAGKPVSVAFAAPLVLNMAAGISFVVDPITGNFQLANPTGITAEMVGRTGSVTFNTGAGGFAISYGTYWKPQSVHQTISVGASKNDTLYYEIKTPTRIEYSIGRDYLA